MFQFVDPLILHPTVVRLGHVLTDAIFTVKSTYRQTWEWSVPALVLHSICFIIIVFHNILKNVADGAFGLMIFSFIPVWVSSFFLFLFFFLNFCFTYYRGTIRCTEVFLGIVFYLYKIQIEILKTAIQLLRFAIFAWFTAILKAQINYFMYLIEFLLKSLEPVLELLHVVKIYVFVLEIIFYFTITMIERLEFDYSF